MEQYDSDVVRLERPDLEKQRNELIVNINKAKNELKVRPYQKNIGQEPKAI